MSERALKIGRRCGLAAVEALMGIIVLVAVVTGLMMWRLNQGPIEVEFARKFIEGELSDPSHNISMHVGQIFLAWSEIDARPQITLEDVKLLDTKADRIILGFESAALTVSRGALLTGRVLPRTVVITKPLITLIRGQDNHLSFGFQLQNAPDANAGHEDVFTLLDELSAPREGKFREGPLKSIRTLMITDARMMVEDQQLGESWLVPRIDIAVDRDDASLTLAGSLWLEDAAAPAPTLKMEAAYEHADKSVLVNAVVQSLRATFLADKFPSLDWLKNQDVTLDGKAQARIGQGLAATGGEASLVSHNGAVTISGLYDHPIAYKTLGFDLSYDGATQSVALTNGQIGLTDNTMIGLTAGITVLEDGTMRIPLDFKVADLPEKLLAEDWPTAMKNDQSGQWVLHKLSDGKLVNSDVSVVIEAQKQGPYGSEFINLDDDDEWMVALDSLKADFNVENLTVNYRAPLTPLTRAEGHGTYDYATDILAIDVKKGAINDVALTGGRVQIDHVLGHVVGTADIDANIEGPLKSVLAYLKDEPIGVSLPTDVARAEGTASAKIGVSLPTRADVTADEVQVAVEGKADNALLPGLVSGMDVKGGPVAVTVKDGRVDASGKAQMGGHDGDFTLVQYFSAKDHPYSGQIVANLLVDTPMRKQLGIDLADWIDGVVPAKVTYTTFGDGRTEIDASIDATPATLMVGPMNYTKAPGVAASASAKAFLDHGQLTAIKDLTVTAEDAKIANAELTFSGSGKETALRSGKFPDATLKDSNATVNFSISPDNIMTLDVKGESFDGTPFLENDRRAGDYTGPGLKATVNVTQMTTAPSRRIGNVRLALDLDKQGVAHQVDLDAQAGKGAIAFHYKPDQDGNMTLQVMADDAGAALSDFDVYDSVRGGKLEITGRAVDPANPGLISGKAALTDFRVADAPVLARLVNALSLTGVFQLLGGEGIAFTRLESDFTWEKRKGVDLITLKDGRTSGASIGLTFDGTVDRVAAQTDIHGTIVPVSMVNELVSDIPLIGNLLAGGSRGGLFAATYSIKGPAGNPETSVNPLAILAPGFLRRIFFEEK